MKIILFTFILMSNLSYCQRPLTIVDKDSSVSLFQLIWKLEPNNIKLYNTESEFFYKTLILPLSESESNMEGEIKHRVYVLKGEYGEFPSGMLYLVGDFYNIIEIDLIPREHDGMLKIEYGPLIEKQRQTFLVK